MIDCNASLKKYLPVANEKHTESVRRLQADAESCTQAQVVVLTAGEHRADVAGSAQTEGSAGGC